MVAIRVVNPARVVATGLALCALLVGAAVALRDPLPGELEVLRGLHAEEGGAAAAAWAAVSDASDLLPLVLVAVVGMGTLIALGRARSAALVLAAVSVPWTLNPVLKAVIGRERPDLWPLGDVSEHAFPAGHAANSTALVVAVVVVLLGTGSGTGTGVGRRTRLVVIGVAAAVLLLVGVAQLALGRHYPSDVLAGWLWAGAWVAFVVSLPARDRLSRR